MLHEKQGEYPNRKTIKTREMSEHRPQLLQKHYVLLANIRSAKFLHNKSCGVFFLHISILVFFLLHFPLQTGGREKGTIGKT